MEQPHRQAIHLQPFAPGAIDRDAPRRDDRINERRLRAGRQPRENLGEIAERAGCEAILGFSAQADPPSTATPRGNKSALKCAPTAQNCQFRQFSRFTTSEIIEEKIRPLPRFWSPILRYQHPGPEKFPRRPF
jgi:hypothetical protein